MSQESNERPLGNPPDPDAPALPRVFVREPGWRIATKADSAREFCYQIAPGQDFYHRLGHDEVYVYLGDERLCLPCAGRRGLLAFEPKALRQPIAPVEIVPEADSTIPVEPRAGASSVPNPPPDPAYEDGKAPPSEPPASARNGRDLSSSPPPSINLDGEIPG